MVTNFTLISLLAQALLVRSAVYNATFTWYGQGDMRGSPNCKNEAGTCGLQIPSGFTAAVSQNLFGPTDVSADYCGKCLKLNAASNPFTNETLDGAGKDVVVMINNLCPVHDTSGNPNPLCSQRDLATPNEFGGQIDVNVCADSGARESVFGGGDVGLAFGTAEEVDCADFVGGNETVGAESGGARKDGATRPSEGVRGKVGGGVVVGLFAVMGYVVLDW